MSSALLNRSPTGHEAPLATIWPRSFLFYLLKPARALRTSQLTSRCLDESVYVTETLDAPATLGVGPRHEVRGVDAKPTKAVSIAPEVVFPCGGLGRARRMPVAYQVQKVGD